MKKHSWLMKLAAYMVVVAMLFGCASMGYSETSDVTNPGEGEGSEVTEPVPEPEPEPEPQPEPEPEPEPEPKPDDDSQPGTLVTELDVPDETRIEEDPDEDEPDDEESGDEDFDFEDDDLVEFEDDDPGAVSEDLLQQFNNPDNFERVEFSGSADIKLKNADNMWTEGWDGRITLIAQVRDANLSYRLVWEANDHDDRGWFTVGSGTEYSYTLTRENAERESKREYRVVMFTVD